MDSLITAAARALAAGDPLGALKRVALRDDGSVQKVLSETSKTLPQAILERLLGILNWAGIASLATPPTSHSRAIAGHPELGRYRIARDVPSANRGEVMSPPKESKGSPTVRRSGRFAAKVR